MQQSIKKDNAAIECKQQSTEHISHCNHTKRYEDNYASTQHATISKIYNEWNENVEIASIMLVVALIVNIILFNIFICIVHSDFSHFHIYVSNCAASWMMCK